jgi:hypothetical protein
MFASAKSNLNLSVLSRVYIQIAEFKGISSSRCHRIEIFGFSLLPLVQEYGLRSRPSAEELGVNGPNSDKAPLPTEEHPGPRQEQNST